MAKNEFTDYLKDFLKIATDLDHLVTLVPWLHKMAAPTIKKSNEILQKQGAPPDRFGPATGSGLIDIFHDGEYVTRAPVDKRISHGKALDQMIDEINGRTNASNLTCLHETWEAFVKRSYATLLFQLRDDVSPPSRAGFHEANRDWRTYRGTSAYFLDYANWACRADCSEAMRVFKKELNWALVHVEQWNGIEWMDVVRMLAFCRHCVVHNDGRVAEDRWKKLNKPQRDYVQAMMRKTILIDEDRVLPPTKHLDRLIEAMMSLGRGLYMLLSNRCGMAVDYDPFKAPPRPRRTPQLRHKI